MSYSVLPHVARLGIKPGRLFIDGQWRDARSDERYAQIHPATNEVVGDIAIASPTDLDLAVRAARRAFDEGPWPTMPARDRIKLLRGFVDLARAEAGRLTEIQVLDNSNPISIQKMNYLVNGEVVADVFEHAIGWIDKLNGSVYPSYAAGPKTMMTYSVREPIGVVAAIIPWNSPIFLLCQKIAPALAAGCTLVIKPSEHTSLTALAIVDLFDRAGLPPGVVNLVTGPGDPTGEALIAHPLIDKITFTGSRSVGQHIMRAAAGGMKRLSLELGGKSPMLIFDDAPDPTAAAAMCMSAVAFGMSGQTCAAATRLLVHERVFDKAIEGALSVLGRVKHGDPFDPSTTSAPLISKRQLARVEGFVARGRDAGAEILGGGERSMGGMEHGNFYKPTLVVNAANESEIAREEIFGPVITAIPFRDEDDAIRLANDNSYGLSAWVMTGSMERGLRVSRRLRSGGVNVNGATLAPNMPFGGFKESGVGREGAWEGVLSFTELKTVNLTG